MRVLVVGGAGYIGSHAVRECRRAGLEPVVFDNLSTGNRESVEGVELIEGDLLDPRALRSTFENDAFDAVFHFAASASVPESVAKPALYYHNNVAGSLNLVHAMLEAGVERLIFSSTAATYGDPVEVPNP
ncbi:MAG: NAD-dependent epimerase/dehydratase family protein, partial [Planctomycetota bacterium]